MFFQTCENERASLRMTVMELEDRLADATKEINSITSDYISVKESHSHAQGNGVFLDVILPHHGIQADLYIFVSFLFFGKR